MATLPGIPSDTRTPGGMPDTYAANPGAPMPSMPKMGPGPGPTAPGVPDPAKLEELFTQYTAGQITREDLINQLSTFSEGQGGILGLLEGAQQQPQQSAAPAPQMAQPPAQPSPQPLASNTLPTQGIRPETGQPLDVRHQQIAQLLQGYGLGPADAAEMAQILNPHEAGHKRTWSDDEGLWIDEYEDTAKQQAALKSPSAGIAWDPTLTGRQQAADTIDETGTVIPGQWSNVDTGSAAAEMRAQAGLGLDAGSIGGGYARRYDKTTGDTDFIPIGDIQGSGTTASDISRLSSDPSLSFAGRETAWKPTVTGAAQAITPGYEWTTTPSTATSTAGTNVGVSADPLEQEILPEPVALKPGDKKQIGGETYVYRIDKDGNGVWDKQLATGSLIPDNQAELEKFIAEGGIVPGQGVSFHAMFGGSYDPTKYGETGQTSFNPWGLFSSGKKGGPFQDPTTGEWFPTEGDYKDYRKLVAEGNPLSMWGMPGVGAEFSHWVDKHGNKIERDQDGGLLEGARAVAKNTVRVTVDTINDDGSAGKETYYLPTDGLTQEQIDGMVHNLQVNKWLPWGSHGEEGYYLKGYGDAPGAFIPTKKDDIVIPPPGAPSGKPPSGKPPRAAPGGDQRQPVNPNALPPGARVDDQGDIFLNGVYIGSQSPWDGSVSWTQDWLDDPNNPVNKEPLPGRGGELPSGGDLGPGMAGGYTGGPGPTSTGGTVSTLALSGLSDTKYPMLNDLLGALSTEEVSPLTNPDITKSLLGVMGTLEGLYLKGDQEAAESVRTTTREALDRDAVTKRGNLDRDLQRQVATGVVIDAATLAETATLAAQAEENKRVFDLSQTAGYIPKWDDQTQTWQIDPDKSQTTIERQALTISETDKVRSREIDVMNLFGKYIEPGQDVNKTLQTLEAKKFGFTQAIQIAEQTGKIPTSWAGDATITGESADTFTMKQFVWERDMQQQTIDVQSRLAANAEQTQTTNLTIANNKNATDRHIADGNLKEAIESRKDATWLESQRIELEKDKLKLDTLMSLANPASFLFAKRYGILDDIGLALGINWGDDVPDEIPLMLEPNTIPTLTDFQNATPTQREIMLAEMASSGGYTSNEAVKLIIEGAPGAGRNIRRPSILGVSR